MRHDLEVVREVSKTKKKLTLYRTDRSCVEVEENAIAVPVMSEKEHRGFVFHGKGRLILDAIAETNEGAIGRSIERELLLPFLMLSGTVSFADAMTGASDNDLKKLGYNDGEEFTRKAQEMLDEHLDKAKLHGSSYDCHNDDGVLFAIQNNTGKLDFLLAKGSKLLYKSANLVFMWHDGKVVLSDPNVKMVVSNRGRCVVMHR